MTQPAGATPEANPATPATGAEGHNSGSNGSNGAAGGTEDDQAQRALADAMSGNESGQQGQQGLGDAGKKALQAEREARKALEKQLGELSPLLNFVQQIRGGQAVPDSQKTEAEQLAARLAEVEKVAVEERTLRLRLEVATEKGLTPAQANRLTGSTREELAADADELLALFPQQPATANGTNGTNGAPGTPRPDPTQGARGAGPTIDARIAEAQAKGDWKTVISLQNEKLKLT